MSIPPSQWNDVEAYQKPKCRVVYSSYCVVSDTAERGVKLFEEFNTLLTKDEDEKQFLLQVVEVNSKPVPTEAKTKDVIHALWRWLITSWILLLVIQFASQIILAVVGELCF